jgi:hypothetical protein
MRPQYSPNLSRHACTKKASFNSISSIRLAVTKLAGKTGSKPAIFYGNNSPVKGYAKSYPASRTASNNCLPYLKKNYFLAEESTFLAALSTFLAEESTFAAELSTFIAELSTFAAVVSVFASVLALLLQAANAPMANTTKSFFIVNIFFIN